MLLFDIPPDLFYLATSFMCHRSLSNLSQVSHRAGKLVNERTWEICFAVQFRNHKYVDPARMKALFTTSEDEALEEKEEDGEKVGSQTVDWKRLYRTTQQSIHLFNRDPSIWEQFWFENTKAEGKSQASSVARFLFDNVTTCTKTTLNTYLTGSYHRDILREFVSLFDFRGILFEWALRMFIAIVWLPRSSKSIDRLLHAFSEEYCQQNPRTFRDPDAVYALCFSLMMLSTDLHNPGVKTKITSKQWINSTDGVVDSGASLPMMMGIYDSVRLCPLIWELAAVKMEGWLEMTAPPREGKLTSLVDTGVQELSKRIPGRFSRVFSQLLPHVWCTVQDGIFCAYDSPKLGTVVLRLELKEAGGLPPYDRPRLEWSSSSDETSDSDTEPAARAGGPPVAGVTAAAAAAVTAVASATTARTRKTRGERKQDPDKFPRNPTFADHNLLPGEAPYPSRLPIAINHHGNRHLFWALTQADRDRWLPTLHFNIHAEQHGLLQYARFIHRD